MYCPHCGAYNADEAGYCTSCGASLSQSQSDPGPANYRDEPLWEADADTRVHIPNYLVQAILVTIFCCLIPGIVAIVYAAQVNGKLAAGDIAGARRASNNAKTWAWVSFGLGLVVILIWGASLGFGAG